MLHTFEECIVAARCDGCQLHHCSGLVLLLLQGVKAALLRCYSSLSPAVLAQGCSEQPQAWPRLLFVLGFFHALVLERRKFGSLGWNTKYDFSDGDFLCARQTLSMFLRTQVSTTAQWLHTPRLVLLACARFYWMQGCFKHRQRGSSWQLLQQKTVRCLAVGAFGVFTSFKKRNCTTPFVCCTVAVTGQYSLGSSAVCDGPDQLWWKSDRRP